jgi:hypothetical protein
LRIRKSTIAAILTALAFAVCGAVILTAMVSTGPLPRTKSYEQRLTWTAANVTVPADANPDDAFKVYAVNVVHTTPFREPFVGYGIYLGAGMIITAAHVVGSWPALTNPRVLIAGADLPATVIKHGSVDQVDLALLAVDEFQLPMSLRLRRNPLCARPASPGTRVVDVTPERVTSLQIISPNQIAQPLRPKYDTLVDDEQISGSGIFHADKKCLLGIISKKIEKYAYRNVKGRPTVVPSGFAGYFVPAAKIGEFIPPNLKF